jgi:hypothetical protein
VIVFRLGLVHRIQGDILPLRDSFEFQLAAHIPCKYYSSVSAFTSHILARDGRRRPSHTVSHIPSIYSQVSLYSNVFPHLVHFSFARTCSGFIERDEFFYENNSRSTFISN